MVGVKLLPTRCTFRCGSGENPNKLNNLELLPNSYHKNKNKELHWYPEGDCPYDENGIGPNLGTV